MNYDSDDIFLEEEHLLLSYKNAGDKELKEQYRYALSLTGFKVLLLKSKKNICEGAPFRGYYSLKTVIL